VDEEIDQEMIALLPRLRHFALSLTANLQDADDLVQATCERAIRNLDKWRRGSRLDSWMYRIAQNLHRNAYRDGRTRDRHLAVLEAEASIVPAEDQAYAHVLLGDVGEVIDRLPAEQRSVLLLVAVEGRSYKEAADILSIPVGTVTSRLARAREAIMRTMEGQEP